MSDYRPVEAFNIWQFLATLGWWSLPAAVLAVALAVAVATMIGCAIGSAL